MSSSYSSLDWVLSHWPISLCVDLFVFVYFCVFMFHTAYLLYHCEHGDVDLMRLKPDPLDLFLQCFDSIGWSFDP